MHSAQFAAFDGEGADGDVWFEVDGYPPTEGIAVIDFGDGSAGNQTSLNHFYKYICTKRHFIYATMIYVSHVLMTYILIMAPSSIPCWFVETS